MDSPHMKEEAVAGQGRARNRRDGGSTPQLEAGADASPKAGAEPSERPRGVDGEAPQDPPDGAGNAVKRDDGKASQIVDVKSLDLTVGQSLMEARGDRGLTIAEVAARTRVPWKVIETLEGDDIGDLPAAFYTRSHITQLCREYGVPPEPVLEQYETLAARHQGGGNPDELVLTSRTTESGSRVQYRPKSRAWGLTGEKGTSPTMVIVGAACLVLLLLVAASISVQQWKHYRERQADAEEAQPARTTTSDVDLSAFAPQPDLPLKALEVP